MRGFYQKLTLVVCRIVQSHSGGLGFEGCVSNSASYCVEKVKIWVTPIRNQRTTDILLLVHLPLVLTSGMLVVIHFAVQNTNRVRGFSEKLTLRVGRIVQSHSGGLGFGGA